MASGDRFVSEGISYAHGAPKRGDIVVFRTKGLAAVPQNQRFVKRIVGLPGEHLKIQDGKLFINGSHVVITNSLGPLSFPSDEQFGSYTNISLGEDDFYVIGDNTQNSLDSRMFGPVPRSNITSRYWFRYSRTAKQ